MAHELVIVGAALDVIARARPELKAELRDCLKHDLEPAPNPTTFFDFNRRAYRAVVLQNGYTAVVRNMVDEELRQLREQQMRLVARRGIMVLDLLPAEAAISGRWMWLRPPADRAERQRPPRDA